MLDIDDINFFIARKTRARERSVQIKYTHFTKIDVSNSILYVTPQFYHDIKVL